MVVCRWLPYRARDGRVYFATRSSTERGGGRESRWDLPQGCVLVSAASSSKENASHDGKEIIHEVVGDGLTAVNDASSWSCYIVEDDSKSPFKGERYYVNSISGERSFRCPPGCDALPPVNVASSWLTFCDESRDGQRYYQNKVSKEITWMRPRCLGAAKDSEHGNDDAVARWLENKDQRQNVDDEYQIPEEYDDMQFDSDFSQEQHEEEQQEEDQNKEKEDEEDIKDKEEEENYAIGKPRKEKLDLGKPSKERHDLEKHFHELLDERGIQRYSSWCNWARKLDSDPRCKSVPLELRAHWFDEFRKSLIGRDKETRIRRVKACRKLVRELLKTNPQAYSVSPKTIMEQLSALRDDENQAELAIRLSTALAGLCAADQLSALLS